MGCSCVPGALIRESKIHQTWKTEQLQVKSHTQNLLLSLLRSPLEREETTTGRRSLVKKKLRLKGGVRFQLQPPLKLPQLKLSPQPVQWEGIPTEQRHSPVSEGVWSTSL